MPAYPGCPGKEAVKQVSVCLSRDDGVAVASAGPYGNHLHLAPDR